jgi:hypothetical protein
MPRFGFLASSQVTWMLLICGPHLEYICGLSDYYSVENNLSINMQPLYFDFKLLWPLSMVAIKFHFYNCCIHISFHEFIEAQLYKIILQEKDIKDKSVMTSFTLKRVKEAGYQWLMPVILAASESEIGKIKHGSHPGQIVCETPFPK